MHEPSTTAPHYPELGFYGLAGHTDNPRDLLGEVMEAEQLGLGSVFLSERFNYKDAAVMAGAAVATARCGPNTTWAAHRPRPAASAAIRMSRVVRLNTARPDRVGRPQL